MVNASKEELKALRERVNPVKAPEDEGRIRRSSHGEAAKKVRERLSDDEIIKLHLATSESELSDYDLGE